MMRTPEIVQPLARRFAPPSPRKGEENPDCRPSVPCPFGERVPREARRVRGLWSFLRSGPLDQLAFLLSFSAF